MTLAGARGQTEKEMSKTLGFSQLQFNVHSAFQETLESMTENESVYELTLANGMFLRRGYYTYPSFRSILANKYSAAYKELDFDRDPSACAKYINDWVAYTTDNNIEDIVSADDLKSATLALVNAIYFKGSWKNPFDKTQTKHTKFYVPPSRTPLVNMMIQTADFQYAQNDQLDCQILELPYEGDRLAMYILLPTEKDGLGALESKLTIDSVTSALADLSTQRISVAIPRFETRVDVKLSPILREMGMKRLLSETANLSGMCKQRSLWVTDVIHKAFIGVDERGTEAAAATAVVVTRREGPLPLREDFTANHPFLFLIRDNDTGSILFLGRLVDPSK